MAPCLPRVRGGSYSRERVLFVLGAALGLCCYVQISSDSGGGGCSQAAVCGPRCGDCSCGARARLLGLRACGGAQAQLLCGTWDLVLRPGSKPVSPAWAGVFSITGPPGKSQEEHSKVKIYEWVTSLVGEGDGTPLQYSCLENPMDRGAWWAAVCGVAQSQTQLKRLSSNSN